VSALALPELAARINAAHDAAFRSAQSAIEAAVECGRLLIQAKAALTHGEWLTWLEANTRVCARQSQKYMALARTPAKSELSSFSTINDALAAIAEPKEDSAHTLRVMGSSESPEWYTPPQIVERVTAALGEIDLDPSWHPESPVRARTTYARANDGLAQRWAGRVFLNPPYGREIDGWIAKLVEEYGHGAVTEAIALVPARVDTEWFRRLDPFPRCFVYGRLTFANADNPAPFPSAVVYLGRHVERFVEAFSPVGGIFVRLEECAA
jgi:hypothetical protein